VIQRLIWQRDRLASAPGLSQPIFLHVSFSRGPVDPQSIQPPAGTLSVKRATLFRCHLSVSFLQLVQGRCFIGAKPRRSTGRGWPVSPLELLVGPVEPSSSATSLPRHPGRPNLGSSCMTRCPIGTPFQASPLADHEVIDLAKPAPEYPAMWMREAEKQLARLRARSSLVSCYVDPLIIASSGHVNNREVRWPFSGLPRCCSAKYGWWSARATHHAR
jgi:hypothetical protein